MICRTIKRIVER